MSEPMTLDMKKINSTIADRTNVFYWQTDRVVEPAKAGQIWADRHKYFTDAELVERVNTVLDEDKLIDIVPLDLDAQTNLGNVNSAREGRLFSGKNVILRCHPKGVLNGYFHVEAVAARKANNNGLPSYNSLAIHDYTDNGDFAFHVTEKLPGTAIYLWLKSHPEDEATLLPAIGRMMARIHQIKVDGFGPFNNELAKTGGLVGLHETFGDAVRAGLPFNLEILQAEGIISNKQAAAITGLFSADNPLLDVQQAALVHNDFADWNLLTDGRNVTGILDWDECIAGDPMSDIACWSTFFEPKRLESFLSGYWQIADKPIDFEDRFELLRLRYVISKMTLRLRRYTWDRSDYVQSMINTGKAHLIQSMEYFKI